MSTTASGSVHSTIRRSPLASLASILRVRKTGKGQFRPRKSRQTEEYPEIIFGGAFNLA
jgi:hypothetical protein